MHLAALVFFVIVAFLGTIGNLLIIGGVCIHKPLRTFGNAFVANLATADLIVTSYIMPMGLVASQFEDKPFSDTVCKVDGFLIMCTLGVSTQTLMVIALERYFHVCRKTLYHKLFSKKLTILYVVLIWCYTAAWTVQGYTGWSDFKYVSVVWICMMDAEKSFSFNMCILIFGVLLPISVQIFSYASIFYKLHKSNEAVRRSASRMGKESPVHLPDNRNITQTEQRFLVMLVTIVVIFIVCWTPTGLVMTLMGAGISAPLILYPIAIWLSFSNSSMNSVIYGIMNRNFRRGYRQILRKIACLENIISETSESGFLNRNICCSSCSKRLISRKRCDTDVQNLNTDDQRDEISTTIDGTNSLRLSTITLSTQASENRQTDLGDICNDVILTVEPQQETIM
uniref:Orphan G-protein coupled receptor 31 n=1 Tax=Platynereis dumerilii TaxID=6359 RepID=A0A0K0PVN4_PLADU|nr:orphan G-protein coupled receptor 31 [Platynereis dumerilii]